MTTEISPNHHNHYRYVVVCPDNVQRHADTFETIDDAVTFADYGHVCLAADQHAITRTASSIAAARTAWQQQQLDKAARDMAAVLQAWDTPSPYLGKGREIDMTLDLLAAARALNLAATAAVTTTEQDSSK